MSSRRKNVDAPRTSSVFSTHAKLASIRRFLVNRTLIAVLIGLAAGQLVVRHIVVSTTLIDGESMLPTLQPGEHVLVDHLTLGGQLGGVRVPGLRSPHRGDIVLFRTFKPTAIETSEILCKRVVAVGGDTLFMRSGKLTVNGRSMDMPIADPTAADIVDNAMAWQDSIAADVTRFGERSRQASSLNWGPLIVPAEHVFLIGDNAAQSKDSRHFGFVSPRDLVGLVRTLGFKI